MVWWPPWLCSQVLNGLPNFRTYKALIAAEISGTKVDVAEVAMGKTNRTDKYLAKFPLGKVSFNPVIEPLSKTRHVSVTRRVRHWGRESLKGSSPTFVSMEVLIKWFHWAYILITGSNAWIADRWRTVWKQRHRLLPFQWPVAWQKWPCSSSSGSVAQFRWQWTHASHRFLGLPILGNSSSGQTGHREWKEWPENSSWNPEPAPVVENLAGWRTIVTGWRCGWVPLFFQPFKPFLIQPSGQTWSMLPDGSTLLWTSHRWKLFLVKSS